MLRGCDRVRVRHYGRVCGAVVHGAQRLRRELLRSSYARRIVGNLVRHRHLVVDRGDQDGHRYGTRLFAFNLS